MDQKEKTFNLANDILDLINSREDRPQLDECIIAFEILLGMFLHKIPKEERHARVDASLMGVTEVVKALNEQHELN